MKRRSLYLVATATIAVLSTGCVSNAVPEAGIAKDLIVGRIQTSVNEYCRKSEDLRLAYRAIAAEATYPHVVKIECARVSWFDSPTP